MGGFLSAFKMETGQVLIVSCGILLWFWSKGAPECVLWMVTGLAGLFIVFEKVRATVAAWKGVR